MAERDWTPRSNGGILRICDDLGLVEIFRAEDGYAIDINGVRAWSCCRGDIRAIRQRFDERYDAWDYLNTFKRSQP